MRGQLELNRLEHATASSARATADNLFQAWGRFTIQLKIKNQAMLYRRFANDLAFEEPRASLYVATASSARVTADNLF